MKTYSVKEIADMLGTSQETVRRWIRSGKLKAVQESRKSGNNVTENDLHEFLKHSPKYASIAAATSAAVALSAASPLTGIPMLIGGVLAARVSDQKRIEEQLQSARIRPEDVEQYLMQNIAQHTETLHKKEKMVAQIQEEIESEQKQIEVMQGLLAQVKNTEGDGEKKDNSRSLE